MHIEWHASKRFHRDFNGASPRLQHLAVQELRHLERSIHSGGGRLRYDTVEGCGLPNVRELELGGGHRLLAHVSGNEVTAFRMGGHAVVSEFKRARQAKSYLRDRSILNAAFFDADDKFFPPRGLPRPDRLVRSRFREEISPTWAYYLDDDQHDSLKQSTDSIEGALLSEEPKTIWINGGPGTGKTVMLLQLLLRLSREVLPGNESWGVGLIVSDPVAQQISESSGLNLEAVRRNAAELLLVKREQLDVLLVDDPASFGDLDDCLELLDSGYLGALVVAFDPLQLAESIDDETFESQRIECDAAVFELSRCYRQKAQVGKVAKSAMRVIADSSPFLDTGKQERFRGSRSALTRACNSLTFPNESGYASTHHPARFDAWCDFLDWVVKQGTATRPWEKLAILVEEDIKLSKEWRREVKVRGIASEKYAISRVKDLKGLEFAHVAIFISEKRYSAVTHGFKGTGQRLYNDFRLLRIPFSRARDSLTIWVLPDD